jgi:hypothetical protein
MRNKISIPFLDRINIHVELAGSLNKEPSRRFWEGKVVGGGGGIRTLAAERIQKTGDRRQKGNCRDEWDR